MFIAPPLPSVAPVACRFVAVTVMSPRAASVPAAVSTVPALIVRPAPATTVPPAFLSSALPLSRLTEPPACTRPAVLLMAWPGVATERLPAVTMAPWLLSRAVPAMFRSLCA